MFLVNFNILYGETNLKLSNKKYKIRADVSQTIVQTKSSLLLYISLSNSHQTTIKK